MSKDNDYEKLKKDLEKSVKNVKLRNTETGESLSGIEFAEWLINNATDLKKEKDKK